jgi:hypothetical protein
VLSFSGKEPAFVEANPGEAPDFFGTEWNRFVIPSGAKWLI